MPLLEAWEGSKPGTSQSRVHTPPLRYITREYYSREERGAAGARRMHLQTALLPAAILTKGEKVEGSHAPGTEIKPTSSRNEQQSPEVQISLTHHWLPWGSAQLTAG